MILFLYSVSVRHVSACHVLIIVTCLLFFSISDCMAIPKGWMFYFIKDWLYYDSEEESKSCFSWTEERRIVARLASLRCRKDVDR
jgi:hypothetical protein